MRLAVLRISPERWLLLEIDGTLTGVAAGVQVAHRLSGPLPREELDRVLRERLLFSQADGTNRNST